MASLTFAGTPITTAGTFPTVGQPAPEFNLIQSNLSHITLADLKGQKVVFNIFPSIDTPVCALQLKTFTRLVSEVENTALVFASLDLPFAFGRFCVTENIENAITASDYRHHSLADNYGVKMNDGPLAGLYARAVLVLDESHQVVYSELVEEVKNEPHYDQAITALQGV